MLFNLRFEPDALFVGGAVGSIKFVVLFFLFLFLFLLVLVLLIFVLLFFVLLFFVLLFFAGATFGVEGPVGIRGTTPGISALVGGTMFFSLLFIFVLLKVIEVLIASVGGTLALELFASRVGNTAPFACVGGTAGVRLIMLVFLGASQRITTEVPQGIVISF